MVYMYMRPGEEGITGEPRWAGSSAVVGLAAVLTLFMGLIPSWFSGLMR
jgi:NADH:ubiquinone oxidoreductase subunit 2 (subunit N)